MTVKDKAEELVKKFSQVRTSLGYRAGVHSTLVIRHITRKCAIECAIISVNEILDLCEREFDTSIYSPADYWQKVKIELEKMK
ncbi:hypothetical protein CMT89_08315 [Elizabethkingia anophelis]|nr:hypothetical protein [Elizabethkingia anophelis]MDV4058429.1 hypothetical protein [Elizabethkingia anophelis]